MKKIYRNFLGSLLATALVGMSGCDLDEKIYSTETSENFYQNADQVMGAFMMPYSFMQTHVYQTHFALQEFTTDEAVVPARYGYVDQEGAWVRFHQHTWTPSDQWILLEWQNLFQTIGYCNYFIDGIQDVNLDGMNVPLSKERMIAEVRMVRALHYYWAFSDFREIPLVEHVGEASPAKRSSAEVFAFIETEIKESIGDLPEKGDEDAYGHFTKGAAQALLAKLYLNAQAWTGQARWDDCIAACDAIIAGSYTLDENWNDPFLIQNENSQENIYVVPFDAANAQQFNFLEQNLHENILIQKYGVTYYAWHKISTQESFFDLYQEEDARINQWVVGEQRYIDENGDEQDVLTWEGEPMTVTPYIDMLINYDGGEAQGVMNIKYEIEHGGLSNMNNDMVIFRLADILYMKAEALMRQNSNAATQEAVDLVNSVRVRNFDDPADAEYTTGTLTMDELLNERGRELAYEMHRREDMIRFGHFTDEWWEKSESDASRAVFPIPLNVVTANPNLK
ncbi:RagB/SusD family nutrient uptake outer membrane protein [Fulvivirgaceae bacterium PWU5]|uniref:RagB/SusD family nutrient uptake outer membrane protein n=1 Tax=Dawidia cretensis TaxID=2782350 RepID=A0AAP2GSP0_9BACT|nr:RagB/SusD family nutrient uptake outer membrane protein [Dawidia cretensis]MBT1711986.1 RagB/SusD family nutrient uptake outer membrane protein [Dawidia cretensis]